MRYIMLLAILVLVGCGGHGLTGTWKPNHKKNMEERAKLEGELLALHEKDTSTATIKFDMKDKSEIGIGWSNIGFKLKYEIRATGDNSAKLIIPRYSENMVWHFKINGDEMVAELDDGRIYHYDKK